MNDCVFLIDGIGDYSVIHKINRAKIPNIYYPLITKLLKYFGFNVKHFDTRQNSFTKEQFYKSITTEKPLSILINTNIDNIKHIGRLKLKENFNDINLVLFSDNFDLEWLSSFEDFEFDNFIIQNNTRDLDHFVAQILQQLIFNKNNTSTEISGFSVERLVSDWEFISNISQYNPELNIGSGCSRKCSFCSIADSTVKFRNIDLLMNEIEYLLNNGIKYFHIANHNFSTDLQFMKKFCEKLISRFKERDFVWSCFVIPEYLVADTKIFKLMKESKLGRIELSIESGNNDMLRQYGINSNKKIISNIVNKAVENNIISILGHLIIGAPQESKHSILKTLDFVKQLIQIAPGVIEFNISFLHPDVDSMLYNDLKNNGRSLYNHFSEKGMRKINCMCESKNLTCSELMELKKQLNKEIIQLLRASVFRIDQRTRLTHIEYNKKGLCTQYYFNFLSRSSTFGLYQLKYKNRFFKFYREVENEIDSYAPFLLGRMIKHNKKEILVFDPLLVDGNNSPYLELTDDEYRMVHLADGKKTFKEIVNHLSNSIIDCQSIRMQTLNFYRKLESLDLVLYAKILR